MKKSTIANMKSMILSSYTLVLVSFVAVECSSPTTASYDLDKTTVEFVRLRGYKSIEHTVHTRDGYNLSLVQVLNPLINDGKSGLPNKDVVLMVHGAGSNAKFFVANSDKVEPEDFSSIDTGSMSVEELEDSLKDSPSIKSFAFLLLNFGHEVWLLSRRGTEDSLRLQNSQLTSPVPLIPDDLKSKSSILLNQVNPLYWNYSLDEQAAIDLPECVDYIRDFTDREKIAYVGHSAGGAMLLMAFSTLANFTEKISRSVLWSPALYNVSPVSSLGVVVSGPSAFIGPVNLFRIFREPQQIWCSNGLNITPFCTFLTDFVFGFGGDRQLLQPGYMNPFLNTVGSHEFGQLGQTVFFGKMHRYDYENPATNKRAYGSEVPPLYNASEITSTTMSIWGGAFDALTPLPFIKKIVADLRVPVETHYFESTDLLFNHVSYVTHKDVPHLVIIPSLKSIESLD